MVTKARSKWFKDDGGNRNKGAGTVREAIAELEQVVREFRMKRGHGKLDPKRL